MNALRIVLGTLTYALLFSVPLSFLVLTVRDMTRHESQGISRVMLFLAIVAPAALAFCFLIA